MISTPWRRDRGLQIVGTDALLGGQMVDAVERGDVEQETAADDAAGEPVDRQSRRCRGR